MNTNFNIDSCRKIPSSDFPDLYQVRINDVEITVNAVAVNELANPENKEVYTELKSHSDRFVEITLDRTSLMVRVEDLAKSLKISKETIMEAGHNQRVKNLFTRAPQESRHNAQYLSSLPQIEDISDSICQIPVLPQYEDGTTSGLENCGFHALKNALIILAGMKNSSDVAHLLTNREVFLCFYERYCLPEVERNPVGHRDASMPSIRQALQNFLTDKEPPAQLKQLQRVLKKEGTESLACIAMGTADGTPSGAPIIGTMDEIALQDALKFYRFAKLQGPCSIVTTFGNESMGHWYQITFNKDGNNKISAVACDSMENHHKLAGPFSPFQKMVKVIEMQLKDPQEFMRNAFANIGDQLQAKSGWIDAEGNVEESRRAQLLDASPNSLLAIKGLHNGSNLEQTLWLLHQATKTAIECQWATHTDIIEQQHVTSILNLLNFYNNNLTPSLKQQYHITESLALITAKRNNQYVSQAFQEALTDLESCSSTISPRAYELSRSLLESMRQIYQDRKNLSKGENEAARLNSINQLTQGGAEQGFAVGKNAAEVEWSLTYRVMLLLATSQKAKRNNKLSEFFSRIGTGDPCLSGRMSRVEEMAVSLNNMPEDNRLERALELPGVAIGAAIYSWAEDQETEDPVKLVNTLTPEKFKSTPELVVAMVTAFKAYGRSSATNAPLLAYLKDKGYETDPLDWDSLLSKLITDSDFPTMLAMGKQAALAYF